MYSQAQKEYHQEYYRKNREKKLAYAKQYQEEHKEERQEYLIEYNVTHRHVIDEHETRRKTNPTRIKNRKEHSKKKYHQNPEHEKSKVKVYRQTLNGRYQVYRGCAKSRKIDFELSLEQFELFWKQPCSYCGADIETIGLDRIDSNLSYNENNIIPCCSICNMMKRNYSMEFFLTHINKIHSHMRGTNK
jgi:hypothetical protein